MGAVTGWHGQVLCKASENGECVCVCLCLGLEPLAKGCKSSWEQRVLFSLPADTFLVSDARVP